MEVGDWRERPEVQGTAPHARHEALLPNIFSVAGFREKAQHPQRGGAFSYAMPPSCPGWLAAKSPDLLAIWPAMAPSYLVSNELAEVITNFHNPKKFPGNGSLLENFPFCGAVFVENARAMAP